MIKAQCREAKENSSLDWQHKAITSLKNNQCKKAGRGTQMSEWARPGVQTPVHQKEQNHQLIRKGLKGNSPR
jgi:hypothetical protein